MSEANTAKTNRDIIREKVKDTLKTDELTDFVMDLIDTVALACLMDGDYREEYIEAALAACDVQTDSTPPSVLDDN